MLTVSEAQDRCAALIARAARAGADCADVVYIGNAADSVSVRLGALEEVERSESEHIGLRAFVGQGSASIGSTDFGDAALDELAARAVAMARAAPPDRFAGLAPEEHLLRTAPPELDLDDAAQPSPADLRMMAEAAEDAARGVDGITNSEGAGASAGRSIFALATSHGFVGGYATSSTSLSASVIAGEGGRMQRDYAWRSARHAADLLAPGEIGRRAGERTVRRLDPGRMRSGAMPVVFDPRVGGSLIGHLIGAMSGAAIARRGSFLVGREGAQLFDSSVSLREDAHRPRGLRSRPFDGEGLPTRSGALVDKGRLGPWLMEAAAARQLGLEPTGHAARGPSGAPGVTTGNLWFEAGSATPAELIADIAEGVYITELIGQGVNAVTGDYSRGAAGFRIEGGEITGPIAEFAIAGNLIDMFASLVPANDLEFIRGTDTPTLRIDSMTVAGD